MYGVVYKVRYHHASHIIKYHVTIMLHGFLPRKVSCKCITYVYHIDNIINVIDRTSENTNYHEYIVSIIYICCERQHSYKNQ